MTGHQHQDRAPMPLEGLDDAASDDLFPSRSKASGAGHRSGADPDAGPDDLFWDRTPRSAAPDRARKGGTDQKS